MRFLALALAGALAACGGTGDDGSGTTYASISVEPEFATVTVSLGSTTTQPYKVFGVAADGSKKDITSSCALAIDAEFGTFEAATAKVVAHGGKANIVAGCGEQMGSAVLAVNLVGSVVTPPAPDNAPDLFNSAVTTADPAHIPVVEYPINNAVSPRNMPAIEVQYTTAGNDLFHVRLASTFINVDIYTTTPEAMLSEADWESVVGSAAGDNLKITVEGLVQAAPSMKYASPDTTLVVSRDTIDKTSIYYWASSRGNIMEQQFGSTTPPNVVKDDCTSCHSVSRSGTRVGYSRCVAGNCDGAQIAVGFLRYDSDARTWNEAVNANAKAINGSYTTFAPIGNPYPDDTKSLAIVTKAGGTLSLYDPDTGTPVASNLDAVSTHGTGARSALMPDWSPDGKSVVFTSAAGAGQWIDLSNGSIAIMSYENQAGEHVFGEPQFPFPNPITLANGAYTNFFFPSYSPDGALIVMNAARSGWRSNPARNAGQRLMLADATGAWITDMPAMNGGMVDLDITWAHWAPTVGNDYYWVVFSSERDYGHRITATNTAPACVANGVSQCKQIWIGAVARNKLNGMVDPSAPPMWMPNQDTQADNISPYWSVPAGLQ
ncbi:MAG: hypothetical protein HOV81_37905 [Kofleriaceae bacterium]|nr:hypothetical protein [Kofleriaceae bacterium]